MHKASDRQYDRCVRRAAELLTEGDCILSDMPLPSALIAALDPAIRTTISSVSPEENMSEATLCLLNAETAAVTGSVVCSHAAAACAKQALSLGIPLYILLPGGPDPASNTEAMLAVGADQSILSATMINAIITDRGIYRPAMLARHLQDGDAPLDVIPLH
jgi:hypothetical protein